MRTLAGYVVYWIVLGLYGYSRYSTKYYSRERRNEFNCVYVLLYVSIVHHYLVRI